MALCDGGWWWRNDQLFALPFVRGSVWLDDDDDDEENGAGQIEYAGSIEGLLKCLWERRRTYALS